MRSQIARLALVSLLLLTGGAFSVHAQATITVNSTAQEVTLANPTGTVNGNCTLGEAILAATSDAAVDGCVAGQTGGKDTIIIPAGTYTLTDIATGVYGLGDVGDSILQGAGPASTIIERSSAPGTPDFIFLGIGNVDVIGLTFRNGRDTSMEGGAIQGKSGINTITDCVFDNNFATFRSGAIANFMGALTVRNSVFTNNSSSVAGAIGSFSPPGGETTTVTIANSTFSGNHSTTGPGGAIACMRSGFGPCQGLTITDTTFINNSGAWAGAINVDDNLSVTRCVFIGNTGSTFAGAIVSTGVVTGIISNSLFENNTAGNQSGAINGRVNVSGSTFHGNYVRGATGEGGAIVIGNGSISNSTFSGNHAPDVGGAISGLGGSTYNNITVTDNGASRAGGIWFSSGDSFRNSIVAGNNQPDGPDCEGPGTSLGHNLIGIDCGTTPGTGDLIGTSGVPILPMLSGLATNTSTVVAGSNVGGQTPMPIPTHALLTGSPALGAGDPGTADGVSPHCEATDERGIARPGGATCDIGAFEDATGTGVTANYDLLLFNTDAPDPVLVGNNVTYTLDVSNAAPDPAPAVVLTDTLPTGLTFVSATPSNAPIGSCLQAAGTVTCNLGVLSAWGSVSVTIVVTTTGAVISPMSNTASVSATGNDINPADNSATASTVVTGTLADLALTKSDAPDPINLGAGNVTYTLTVTNNGPGAANNVVVTDTLPGSATFVSATPSQGACPAPAGGVLTCNLGAINNGLNATITVVATPTATGTLTNTASATANETDPNTANNTNIIATTTVNASADLSVTKTDAPDPVTAGSNLTYTITVSNAGPSAAAGVSLNDTLPAGTTFVSLASAAGWACTTPAVGAAGTVTCTIASLASGAPAAFTLVVKTSAAGALNNTATVATTTTDPSAANNSATAGTTVNPAAASDFTITASPALQSISPGHSGTFTITLTPTPAGAPFNNAIQLSVAGELTVGLVSLSQTSVTPGANPANVTMTVTIPPRTGMAPPAPRGPQMPLGWLLLGAMTMAALALLARGQRVPRKLVPAMALLLLMVGGVLLQSACAQKHGNILTGPKTLTVTATSGTLSHSTTVIVSLP